MRTLKKAMTAAAAAALALVMLTACGGSDGPAPSATATPQPAATAAPEATATPAPAATATPTPTPAPAAATGFKVIIPDATAKAVFTSELKAKGFENAVYDPTLEAVSTTGLDALVKQANEENWDRNKFNGEWTDLVIDNLKEAGMWGPTRYSMGATGYNEWITYDTEAPGLAARSIAVYVGNKDVSSVAYVEVDYNVTKGSNGGDILVLPVFTYTAAE